MAVGVGGGGCPNKVCMCPVALVCELLDQKRASAGSRPPGCAGSHRSDGLKLEQLQAELGLLCTRAVSTL